MDVSFSVSSKMMIRKFKHAGLRRFWEHDDSRRLPPQFVDRLRSILTALDEAIDPTEMAAPGRHLHRLNGHPGAWSVRVSANWRIVFRLEDGYAHDVDLVDYH